MSKDSIHKILKRISHYYKKEADLLVELLRESGVKDYQIAEKLGVTKGAISLRFPRKKK